MAHRLNASTLQPLNDWLCVQIRDLHCHLHGVPGNTAEARLGKLLESAALIDSAAGVNCYLSSRRLTTLKLRFILGTFHKRETRPNYETGN